MSPEAIKPAEEIVFDKRPPTNSAPAGQTPSKAHQDGFQAFAR